MKNQNWLFVLLAAAIISLGLVFAADDEPAVSEGDIQKVIENQEKILEKLDQIQEDLQFVKTKTARL